MRRILPHLHCLALAATLSAPWGDVDAREFVEVDEGVVMAIHIDASVRADVDGDPWAAWLRTALGAARDVTGHFPPRRVRVSIEPARTGDSAIAFGSVRRGAIPRLRFHADPGAGLAGLNDDWRGFHEFAHLLIPFPGRDDIWFSEGFASYYQHLLQSRTGILAPDEAWRRIMAGFRRGLDDPAGRGRTLSELSPRMRRERAYRRVYWTGAAFFLRVDTRLRAATDHRLSLDAALASYHACCMRRTRGPDAAALVRELGRTGLPRIWREEWNRTLEGPAEPRFGNALDLLGIRADGDGWILDGDAEARRMRAAIAAPRARDQARGYFSAE